MLNISRRLTHRALSIQRPISSPRVRDRTENTWTTSQVDVNITSSADIADERHK